MKISSVEVIGINAPRQMPTGVDSQTAAIIGTPLPIVIVRVTTNAGIDGIGHSFTLNPEFAGSLVQLTRELGALLIGADPRRPEQLLSKMLYPANWIGPGGLLNIAAAALDVAVWDIFGKETGQPLWRLLGGASNQPRVYDSGSLVATDTDALQTAAAASVSSGYRAMKMRPGNDRFGPVNDVAARVRAIRDVIGYDVELMYDVNQTWTPSRAIRAGRALEEFHLSWIEDPTLMHDIRGQAAVASALDTPVCAGEYHYDAVSLLRLLEARAIDYLMIDLMRMGGITQFRKVAAMAEAFGIPVVSHLVPEVFAHCIAAVPNGLFVEGMPWTQDVFEGLPELKDGCLQLSDRPGHGLDLDDGYVLRHRFT